MQGLEISRKFYLQYGRPMLEAQFADVLGHIAVGLAGEGSECLGFDDQLSRDHDFDPGFCLWISAADEERFGFRLERAYKALPREFMGLERSKYGPVGVKRRGVISIESFYSRFLGAPSAPDSAERWLYTPSFSLAAACNGQVFSDPGGAFSAVREVLLRGYPEDIRRKKLAAHTVLMAQAGQYNYPRCLLRKEQGAGQLAIFEFVKHAISAIYLLNNSYEPFYKWAYRGLARLPRLRSVGEALQRLTELDNSPANAELKQGMIEDIAALLTAEFARQGLTGSDRSELEAQAYEIQNSIRDGALRNMHIMEGV